MSHMIWKSSACTIKMFYGHKYDHKANSFSSSSSFDWNRNIVLNSAAVRQKKQEHSLNNKKYKIPELQNNWQLKEKL